MRCFKPYELDGNLFGCGQCMNCRINKQRTWAARIQMEGLFHMDSTFVTLTYDDDHVPRNEDGSQILHKRDLTLFIKRLRKAYSKDNSRFRFFACGEYGSTTQRPHYHLILFGVGLESESLINSTWGQGFTQVGELNARRSAYIAQYTTKKMTGEHARGLNGRPPEFATMSTRPGIGYPAVPWLANQMTYKASMKEMAKVCDVFTAIRIEGKIWPLGQYIRRKLRDKLGISQNAQERAIQFDHYDRDTGEIFELPPLPDDYCPIKDFVEISSPWSRKHGTKEIKQELPELEKEAINRERKHQKRSATVRI